MSFPPPHMPIIPPMPFLPPGAPMMMPPTMPVPAPANGTHRPGENEKKNKFQVPTTVFVGSISDRAPDVMIKRMLQNCGSVINWKRVQGANGKLQAFGFCEYENPEGTLRCIRLLNGWQIQDKKLVVKVDAKTKVLLDEYKKKKRQELAKKAANDTTAFKFIYEDEDEDGEEEKSKPSNSTDADAKKKSGEEGEIEEEEEDYLDEATRREDHAISQSLETVMREYSREMNQRALEAREAAAREAQAAAAAMPPMSTPPPPMEPGEMSPTGKRIDPTAALDDEEGKRSLITNEIQMFRDRFKDEDTKMRNTEKERKDRYERARALEREKRMAEEAPPGNASPSSRDASPPSSSSRDRSSPSRRDRPSTQSRRDRSSPSDDRHRSSASRNHTSNSVRSRANDRRSSPSSRYDRRSPPSRSYRRSRTKSPVGRAHSNDADDDETYERKKQEKRLKEKEARYRDRLKAWTQRERKKQADYKAEKQRELNRLRDEEKEGKRLLALLEEYKDEEEDAKHYKGTNLVRRLKDREHEIEADNRDRRHEKEEIEELRQKLVQDNVSDVEGEIKRRLEKEEEHVRRRLAELARSSSEESGGESENDDEHRSSSRKENLPVSNDSTSKNGHHVEPTSRPTVKIESPKIEPKSSPKQTSALGGAPISGTKIPPKRKLAVNEAFRDDQDEESSSSYQKKSKLSAIPEPIGQPSPTIKEERTTTPVKGNAAAAATTASNAQSAQVQEEKRQAVRKLIESIPTKKEDLFTFQLDWSLLDSSLMEKRIKPWVTKKIVEYIGEDVGDDEASLTDFICTSIMSKNSAEKILADVRVVLDDEAEVFVVKMWRLLVYEIEAKRQGLSK